MKYKIVTLGCKVNTYESEAVKQLLINEGYTPAQNDEEADALIINTCSVTSISDQKSRQKIRSEIKKNPRAVTVVMGCYAQMESDFIADIPGVHIIIGTGHRHDIPQLIKEFAINKEQINLVTRNRDVVYEALSVNMYADNTRAFLKIQDGCDNFCSYCIIPYARGKMRSRPREEVLHEVHALVDNGFKEIVLTGIHTAGYGNDFPNYSFVDLVRDILKEEELVRLRISSIEESEISKACIELIAQNKKMAHHLHIPLQAGSNHILQQMNRKYNREQYRDKIKMIYQAMPDIAITTDIIVGFPGETDADFAATLALARDCHFAKIHVFPFSPRAGTPAAKMAAQIDPAIKKERVHALMQLSDILENNYQERCIGKNVDVIFEDYDDKRGAYRGHASNYLEVSIKSNEDLRGEMRTIVYKKLDSVQ